MRLANKVQEWLDEMEWEEPLERDEEAQTASYNTRYGIKDQGFDLYIETIEKRDWIQIFLYAPFKARAEQHHQVALLCNRINGSIASGAIHVLDNGRIRFRHTVDMEGAEPSTIMITRMLGAAGDVFDHWFDELSAVALTKTTAQEIFDELDKPKPEESVDSAEATDADPNAFPTGPSGGGKNPECLH